MVRREATVAESRQQQQQQQLAQQQQKRVQRRQQKTVAIAVGEEWVDEWEVASECSEGYNSGYNSDCSSGDREAEVAVAAMRECSGTNSMGVYTHQKRGQQIGARQSRN